MKLHSVLLANKHLKEINPIQFGWEACDPGHVFGPASRSYLLLHYVVSGKGIFERGDSTYRLKAGEVFIIHPRDVTLYRADETDPWQYIWIGFEYGIGLPAALQRDTLSLPGAKGLFLSMRQAASMQAGREAFLCAKIWELFALLEQDTSAKTDAHTGRQQDYVSSAITYLQTEYMRPVSIADMARQLNLDRSYFSNLFKKATGKSPMLYLTQLRLQKAAAMMLEHGHSPGEAALSVGYPDIFAFSKMFRRHYGLSPTQYVKAHRGESSAP